MNIERFFENAKAKGITDSQVFLVDTRDLSIQVFNGELEKYEIAESSYLSIKGIYQGKMATYMTEVMNDESIDTITDRLIENANVIDSPDEGIIYEGDKHYETLTDLYNPLLAKYDVKNKIELVKKLDHLMHTEDKRVDVVETMYSETVKTVMLQNTKGLKLENKTNSAYIGGEVLVKDGSDQRTGFDLVISNQVEDFQVESLAKEIVSDAIRALGAKPVPSDQYEIVFDRSAFATLLTVFQSVFNADVVQKGMSLLKGKLNEVIGSDKVTIVDDPFMKKSGSSRSFDDEGVSTKYKEIVQNGVLKTYLYNLMSAKKDGVSSTGNGFGTSVSAVNLKMMPGEKTREELIQSVEKGLLITEVQGAHAGANPISGDFSLQAMGFQINAGKLGEPVALITVAGSFIQLLKDIVEVGSDIKTSYYGVTCPSILVQKMPVSGL